MVSMNKMDLKCNKIVNFSCFIPEMLFDGIDVYLRNALNRVSWSIDYVKVEEKCIFSITKHLKNSQAEYPFKNEY